MPIYEYDCPSCGGFTALRPMSEYRESQSCPSCGAPAPRAILSAPGLPLLGAAARRAHAVNEQSAHEPRLVSAVGRTTAGKHGPGCACCKPGHSAPVRHGRDGAKSFPTRRPWMISH